ncbi:YfgG family protein [Rahnella sp. PCH160]|uniref:YfgG family protein n=1 Tax=Rahnella sp. PCH160 TaxID=3447928 RepID=UPI0039FCAECA
MSRKSNIKMTKIVLSISFIILLGRLVYSAIGAYSHHQTQKQTETPAEVRPDQTPDKTCTGTLKSCRYFKE